MAAKKTARRTTRKTAPTRKALTKTPARKIAKRVVKKAATRPVPRADKAEGDDAFYACLAKFDAPHRAIGERIDAIVAKNVPGVRRAVKWGSPMWGIAGQGWFAAFASFKSYAKVNFFSGASLSPAPPQGDGKGMRSVNLPTLADLDEKQMATWVKQAAAIPGWGKS